MFLSERDVPTTNNVSERALRPSTIFRNMTNGFRAEWSAELYGAMRSGLATGGCTDCRPWGAPGHAGGLQPPACSSGRGARTGPL